MSIVGQVGKPVIRVQLVRMLAASLYAYSAVSVSAFVFVHDMIFDLVVKIIFRSNRNFRSILSIQIILTTLIIRKFPKSYFRFVS